MERIFENHAIRKSRELGGTWKLTTLPEGNIFTVIVPSCWEQEGELYSYEGQASYKKSFFLTKDTAVNLIFKGVGHWAEVLVDGVSLATHYDAHTPFSVSLPRLSQGEHVLEVIADNRISEESALHISNDYYHYGGLVRPVFLEEISDVFLSSLHVTPSYQGQWSGLVQVTVKNLSSQEKTVCVQGTLHHTDFSFEPITVTGQSETLLTKEVMFEDVLPWNCETPNLYEMKLTLWEENTPVDDLIERIGFRQIEWKDSSLYLNGEKIFIKGFNRHEDFGVVGCAIPLSLMQKDLSLMRQMGANAVRTSHYPNDERFLDLCDEMGFLVWEEGHARGLSEAQMRLPNFLTQSKENVREMIEYHYNHPSIVIWGILNECASDTEWGKTVYQALFEEIKRLDQSRPMTFASCKFFKDICLGLPDVVSYNIYPEWYVKQPAGEYFEQLYDWVQTTEGKGKPFLLSEFGAGGIYGFREPGKPKWSEDRQAEILDHMLGAFMSRPQVSGVFIWQFSDCRVSEENWWYGRPRTFNNKGVVDEYRRPKLAFEVVKKWFTKKE
ncbi:MAG: beta-glucuronidase [Ruminococcaceae bacterium]|nr:beta-glucuronidase [Oscillospiraceae bacterium]